MEIYYKITNNILQIGTEELPVKLNTFFSKSTNDRSNLGDVVMFQDTFYFNERFIIFLETLLSKEYRLNKDFKVKVINIYLKKENQVELLTYNNYNSLIYSILEYYKDLINKKLLEETNSSSIVGDQFSSKLCIYLYEKSCDYDFFYTCNKQSYLYTLIVENINSNFPTNIKKYISISKYRTGTESPEVIMLANTVALVYYSKMINSETSYFYIMNEYCKKAIEQLTIQKNYLNDVKAMIYYYGKMFKYLSLLDSFNINIREGTDNISLIGSRVYIGYNLESHISKVRKIMTLDGKKDVYVFDYLLNFISKEIETNNRLLEIYNKIKDNFAECEKNNKKITKEDILSIFPLFFSIRNESRAIIYSILERVFSYNDKSELDSFLRTFFNSSTDFVEYIANLKKSYRASKKIMSKKLENEKDFILTKEKTYRSLSIFEILKKLLTFKTIKIK